MKKSASRCTGTLKQICENLGEALGSARCRAIRDHLRTCKNCSAYLDSLKKTGRLYRLYPTPKLTKTARKLPHFTPATRTRERRGRT